MKGLPVPKSLAVFPDKPEYECPNSANEVVMPLQYNSYKESFNPLPMEAYSPSYNIEE